MDRHCGGLSYGGTRHGGFQKFATCRELVVATIPDSLSFEKAVVLPLSISTSATALFGILNLRLPSPEPTSTPRKETVLIWGAASSMGSTAVQLAVAAGYSVVTTASAKNHDYVKSLTAGDHVTVFDYAEPDVAAKVVNHIKASGHAFAGGYDCISRDNTVRASAEIIHAFGGGLFPVVLPLSAELPEGVKGEMVISTKPGMVPGYRAADVWATFVSAALEKGTLQAKPEPEVVGSGLDKIQGAIDFYSLGGVSAKKIVVTL
jgi:NADPH:quinone reductase-like Zn-dependent oxidoreductase